jgi:Ca2+-binding RTX toxin-like protein
VRRTAVVPAVMFIAFLANPTANAGTGIFPTRNAALLGGAMASPESLVTGSEFEAIPPDVDEDPNHEPNATATQQLASFPTGGPNYAIMTSGDAALADDSNESGSSGADLDGESVRGNSDFDVSILRVDVQVPSGNDCLSIDLQFFSEEFPEFVGGSVNDAFIAELDTSSWTTAASEITAPNNFAFDPAGNVISVNSSGVANMDAGNAAGTTYDGATQLLRAFTPIDPGPHSVFFSIFDQGDQIYDSAVFLDNLRVFDAPTEQCDEGVEPPPETCEPPTLEGTSFSDKPLRGTGEADRIRGLEGRDFIDGLGGSDELCGNEGSDFVYGRTGADELVGNQGNDRLHGNEGGDVMAGGPGHDAIISGGGQDEIDAQDELKDCILASPAVDQISKDPQDLLNPKSGCPAGFWL